MKNFRNSFLKPLETHFSNEIVEYYCIRKGHPWNPILPKKVCCTVNIGAPAVFRNFRRYKNRNYENENMVVFKIITVSVSLTRNKFLNYDKIGASCKFYIARIFRSVNTVDTMSCTSIKLAYH